MTSLYFEFLKVKEPKLYELCYEVEKYQNVDIDIVMLKCRKALEYIVTSLSCKGANLHAKVNDINNKLNINKDIRNKILALKNKCNESIHYNDEVDNANSKDVINRLVEICHWLIEAKIEKKVDVLINDNIEMLKKKQEELSKAFKKNDFAAVARISEEIKVLSEQQNKDIINIKSDGPSINQIDDGHYLSKKGDIEYYNKAIRGDAAAQAKLADIYYNCYYFYKGEEEQHIKSLIFFWAKKSAEQNNLKGLDMLILCYKKEFGCKEDNKELFKYYLKAADLGSANGYWNLGLCYDQGTGCVKNEEKAFEYYKKGANLGDIDCIKEIAERYRYGTGCEQNGAKAFEYYKKGADLRDGACCRIVGEWYELGFTGRINLAKAFEYYKKGADRGDQDCIKWIYNRNYYGR